MLDGMAVIHVAMLISERIAVVFPRAVCYSVFVRAMFGDFFSAGSLR